MTRTRDEVRQETISDFLDQAHDLLLSADSQYRTYDARRTDPLDERIMRAEDAFHAMADVMMALAQAQNKLGLEIGRLKEMQRKEEPAQ